MNINLIVYSQTGNTYSVAGKIKDELSLSGHTVNIDRLIADQEDKTGKETLNNDKLPDLKQYDVIIFGSPVQAFSLPPVMKSYLKQLKTIENKKVACFVTKALPYNWTGGNNAIRQMKKLCIDKNAVVCGTGIVKWRESSREKDIADVIENISMSIL